MEENFLEHSAYIMHHLMKLFIKVVNDSFCVSLQNMYTSDSGIIGGHFTQLTELYKVHCPMGDIKMFFVHVFTYFTATSSTSLFSESAPTVPGIKPAPQLMLGSNTADNWKLTVKMEILSTYCRNC